MSPKWPPRTEGEQDFRFDPATGAMTIEEGVGVGGESATSGDALRTSMTDAQNVINLIDEIAKDLALPA